MTNVRKMIGDVFAFDRPRVLRALGLSAMVSLIEGAGLALLAPILAFAIGGEAAWSSAAALGVELSFAAAAAGGATLFVCAALTAAFFVWRRSVIVSRIRCDFIADLSKRAQAALLLLPPEQTAGRRRTDMTHLMTVDVNQAGQGAHFIFATAGQVMRIPALAAVAVAMSPGAALTAAAILVVVVLLARPFDRRARRIGSTLIKTGAHMLGRADESLASLTLIKTHKAENRWIARYGAAVEARFNAQHDLVAGQAAARAVSTAGGAVGMALVAWVALVPLGAAIAETTVLVLALSRLAPAVVQFHASWRSMLAAAPSHGRVARLLAEAARDREPPVPPARRGIAGPASVSLRDVAIARVPGGAPVVVNATLNLPVGGLTVAMGRSGAGKSTLGLGLSGLLALDGGEVVLDGAPLYGSERLALRRAAVLVPQDPALFNDTIAGNLRLAAPEAEESDLLRALDAAAAGFVSTLPEGLDTIVGDRGARLSGGERQRIALAQALLARPRLLVLDEATSALDAEAEDRVISSVLALRKETTIVFITHRPALARRADKVIVMRDGRIVSDGSWRAAEKEGDL